MGGCLQKYNFIFFSLSFHIILYYILDTYAVKKTHVLVLVLVDFCPQNNLFFFPFFFCFCFDISPYLTGALKVLIFGFMNREASNSGHVYVALEGLRFWLFKWGVWEVIYWFTIYFDPQRGQKWKALSTDWNCRKHEGKRSQLPHNPDYRQYKWQRFNFFASSSTYSLSLQILRAWSQLNRELPN